MYGLLVRFTCHDTTAATAFDELSARTTALIRAHEPGTLIYTVHDVEDRPLDRVFYELYRDRAAFEDHESRPHVRTFLRERAQYLSNVRVDRLTLTSAKGVPDAQD